MYSAVEKIIQNIFSKKNPPQALILGLSGGPDSMALFYILKDLEAKYGFLLISAHVNHMFRGLEADKEEKYLKEMVLAEGKIIETLKVDVKKIAQERKISNQDAGHQVRKEFFGNLAAKYKSEYVALAHHKDDRVESFFLHLLHGAGPRGLTALPREGEYFDGIRVIRPLLDFTKDEILNFCREQDIFYFKDPSNEKAVYKRNKIRLELIPQLEKEYNPKIREVILRSVEILEEEESFINEKVNESFNELVTKNSDEKSDVLVLNKKAFQSQEKAIQRRLVIKILEAIENEDLNYNYEKIEKIIQLLNEEKGQRSYKLSRENTLEISYEEARFGKQEIKIAEKVEIDIDLEKIAKEGPITLSIGSKTFTFAEGTLPSDPLFPQGQGCGKSEPNRSVPSEASEEVWILGENLTLRNRRDGDIIKPLKGKTKKLKNFLIEKKVPRDARDNLILLASGNEVIWIPGLAFSQNYVYSKNNVEQSGKKLLKVVCQWEREFEK